MKKIVVFFCFLLMAGCVTKTSKISENFLGESISFFSYGVITASGETQAINDEHVAGYESFFDNFYVTENTDEIKAKLGLNFGIIYTIEDINYSNKLITQVIKLPNQGLKNPNTIEKMKLIKLTTDADVGEKSFFGYILSEKWEVKKGNWQFEVYADDELLIKKSIYLR